MYGAGGFRNLLQNMRKKKRRNWTVFEDFGRVPNPWLGLNSTRRQNQGEQDVVQNVSPSHPDSIQGAEPAEKASFLFYLSKRSLSRPSYGICWNRQRRPGFRICWILLRCQNLKASVRAQWARALFYRQLMTAPGPQKLQKKKPTRALSRAFSRWIFVDSENFQFCSIWIESECSLGEKTNGRWTSWWQCRASIKMVSLKLAIAKKMNASHALRHDKEVAQLNMIIGGLALMSITFWVLEVLFCN